MTFIKNLEDLKSLCRICLTSSDNTSSLDSYVDDKLRDSPLIVHVLESLLAAKVEQNADYPVEICHLCRGSLRIIYDLKVLFNKSQDILKKYVSSLHEFVSVDPLPNNALKLDMTENNKLTNDFINTMEENEVDDGDFQDSFVPKKSVKVQITTKKQNGLIVKWLEGNKFIMEKKTSSNFKCTQCNKAFSSQEKFSTHSDMCNGNISCKYCKDKFHSERSLRFHVKIHHGSEPPVEIKCDICDKTFKNYHARSYHKVTRHNTEGKKHTCEICGKAFYFKNSLSQHLECHSRDVSRVVCPICGKSFHYRGGLFYHMKIHKNERNYICSFCNGKFLNMASLKRHTRIHTGERPYTCSFCPKTFCSVSEVRTHERRHTGQKPHKCKYCGKRFITPYNLKLHTSSHVGSEPCEFCGKSYLNAEVLKYHMEIKHNMKKAQDEMTV